MRVVYFGTPDFAVPTLRALAAAVDFDVVLVVTQGAKGPSPVERVANELELPVYRPDTLRNGKAREPLLGAHADLFVVAAFGLILGPRTLAIPRLGSVNVHPSLLPQYRGASPIMAAVREGLTETGVSLIVMDAGIDTGAVVSVERLRTATDDTTASLGAKLADLGATQAARDIPRWVHGELTAVPQQGPASLTRTLNKADGWIDWSQDAAEIERHVRAMWPWPRAWTTIAGSPLQVHNARIVGPNELHVFSTSTEPGTVVPAKKRLIVACGSGALELLVIEAAGRRAMSGSAFLNGLRTPLVTVGDAGAPPPQPALIVPIPA
jgi:methionyl-tRNA formyltransferase